MHSQSSLDSVAMRLILPETTAQPAVMPNRHHRVTCTNAASTGRRGSLRCRRIGGAI